MVTAEWVLTGWLIMSCAGCWLNSELILAFGTKTVATVGARLLVTVGKFYAIETPWFLLC